MLEDPLNERTIIFDSHKNMDHDETFVIVVEYNKTFIRGINMQNQKQFMSLSSDIMSCVLAGSSFRETDNSPCSVVMRVVEE